MTPSPNKEKFSLYEAELFELIEYMTTKFMAAQIAAFKPESQEDTIERHIPHFANTSVFAAKELILTLRRKDWEILQIIKGNDKEN